MKNYTNKRFAYQSVLYSAIFASSILMVSCDEEADVIPGSPAEDSLEAVVTDNTVFLQLLQGNDLVLNAESVTSPTFNDAFISLNNFENGNHIALNGNAQVGQINIQSLATYPGLSVDVNVLTAPEVITTIDTDPELTDLVLTATEIERDSSNDIIEYSGTFTINVTSRIDGQTVPDNVIDDNEAEDFPFDGAALALLSATGQQPSFLIGGVTFTVAPGDVIFSVEVVTEGEGEDAEDIVRSELYVFDRGNTTFSNAEDAIADAEVHDISNALDANGEAVFRLARQSAPETVIDVSGTFEWTVQDESPLE